MINHNGFHVDLGGEFVWYHQDGVDVVIRTPFNDETRWWVDDPETIGDACDGPANWEWAWRSMT